MRIAVAFRAFFASLFNADAAERVGQALSGQPTIEAKPEKPKAEAPKPKAPPKPAEPPKPKRSEAITLLATLQREARFIDFVKEPLDSFSDEQIGAVARDVHRDCGAVLQRMFGLQPAVADEEGASITVNDDLDLGVYRLTGNVSAGKGATGALQHHGWKAAKSDVPTWSGSESAAMVIAEAEVEIA